MPNRYGETNCQGKLMMCCLARIMVGAMLCLLPATAWSTERKATDDQPRIYYLFTAERAEHLNLVAELLAATATWQGDLRLIGIARVRAASDLVAVVDPAEEFIARDEDLAAADLPTALVDAVGESERFMLFAAAWPEGRLVTAPGDLVEALSGVVDRSTDIQENTWGKIKVFFN